MFKKIFIVFVISISCSSVYSEENSLSENNTEFNIFSGMFDFSDDGKRSSLVGIQPVSYTHLTLPTKRIV